MEVEEGQEGSEGFEDEEEDYKMIFVMRMDLKLGLNKMAELVATATLRAYKQMEEAAKTDELKEYALMEWGSEGASKKIVVKAPSEKEVIETLEKAKIVNINSVEIRELPSKLVPPKVESKVVPKKEKKKK